MCLIWKEGVKIMFSKFLNLKPEKQERILNAAINEFSKKGFKNASTDEIVKAAGISKGALFHYFNNKKDLLIYLYDYVLNIVMEDFFGKIDVGEKDILKRLRQVLLIEFTLIKKYPSMFDFVKTINFENIEEVKVVLENSNKGYIMNTYDKVLENIDTNMFKEDLDTKRAINIIFWTFEGFSNQLKEKIKTLPLIELNFDEILSEVDIYIEVLKKSFYK